MGIKIDLENISPEDIKASTDVLKKVIQKEVSSAMQKGLTIGTEKIAEAIGKKISKELKKSIIASFDSINISRMFKKAFRDADFSGELKKGMRDAVHALKKGLKDAQKEMSSFKVSTQQISDASSIGASTKPREPRSQEQVSSVFSDNELTDMDKKVQAFMEKLESYGVPKEKIGDIVENLKIDEDIPEITKETAKNMVKLVDQLKDLEREFSQYEAVLNKASKSGTKREDILSREELNNVDRIQASMRSKQADILRASVGKSSVTSAASSAVADNAPSLFAKAASTFVMGPLKFAISFLIGDIMGALSKTLKDAFLGFNEKNRQGLQSAGQVVSPDTLLNAPNLAIDMFKDLQFEIENSPMLKLFGGQGAFKGFLELQKATGGVKEDTFIDPEQKKKFMDDLKLMGAKALLSGQSLEQFSKSVKEGVQVLGMTQDASESFVMEVANWEKKLNMDTGVLMGHFKSANNSLRMWGHSLSESMGIAKRWGKAIEEGRMSMGDIIDYATALNKQGEGESVFMTQMIAKMETVAGGIGRAVMEKSGGDPLAMRELLRRVNEGKSGTAKELGLKGVSDFEMQRKFRAGMFEAIDKMAKDMAGTGAGSEFRFEELRRKITKSILGLDENKPIAVQEQLRKDALKGGTIGALGVSKKELEESRVKATKGQDVMEKQIGIIDKAKFTVMEAAFYVGGKLMENLTGRSMDMDKDRVGAGLRFLEAGKYGTAEKAFSGVNDEIAQTTFAEGLSKLDLNKFNAMLQKGGGESAAKAVRPILVSIPDLKITEKFLEAMKKGQVTKEMIDTILKAAEASGRNQPTY